MSRENVVDAKFWLQFRPILNFFFLAFVYGYGTLYDVGFVVYFMIFHLRTYRRRCAKYGIE